MKTAVEIRNLSIVLDGQVEALKDITLNIPEGRITGLIGPSGAGKTTLIRSIVGRLQIPEHTIRIFGHQAGTPDLRHQVSYMTQELSVYTDLTVDENLKYFARMAGLNRKQSSEIVRQVMRTVDLSDKADSLVSELSGGQKQRVSLAVALVGAPKLMVLDEPTVGLDPALREKLWQLFNDLTAQGTTLIVSSHSMDEAARCDDLVLIREGTVIAHSTPKELLHTTETSSVEQAFLKLVGGTS